MDIISRDQARNLGYTRFFTGEPCKHGHIVQRYVNSGGCVKCQNRCVRNHQKKNITQYKRHYSNWSKKKRYGISESNVKQLLIEQHNCCAICLIPFTETEHIDHCHTTGQVRGLLCRQCNILLGMAHDNVDILSRAISYLTKSKNSS